MKLRLLLTLSLGLSILGCGGTQYAPVSGKVTYNGKPLPKAKVTFAPVPASGIEVPGPPSVGETNEQGEYTLSVVGKNAPGAFVGSHRVSISALQGPPPDPNKEGSKAQVELVPEKYNAKTELKFDVPAGGTKSADFALTPGTSKGRDSGS